MSEDNEHVQSSFLVAAQMDDKGNWFGIFKLSDEPDALTFISEEVFATEKDAQTWALEAGQAMLFNSLLGMVRDEWDD